MKLVATTLSLTLALAAVPARAGYSIRIQRAQGPVKTVQFQPKAAFLLHNERDFHAMIGTLALESHPTPQWYSLQSAGEGLLKKGLVTAVPVGQEVYFLSPDLKSGEVVSLKRDQSFDTPHMSDTFKRLKKALKNLDPIIASGVTAKLKDLAKLYDAADGVLPEGYSGFKPVSLEGGRKILVQLKPAAKGETKPLALYDAASKSFDVLPGNARRFPLKDIALSVDKTRLVSLKGSQLIARDLKTGKTRVVADKIERATAAGHVDHVTYLKDGRLHSYSMIDGTTKTDSRTGITYSDISSDGRYAVGVARGAKPEVVVLDLVNGRTREAEFGSVDDSFYQGSSDYIAVYGPNELDPWTWAWREKK